MKSGWSGVWSFTNYLTAIYILINSCFPGSFHFVTFKGGIM